MTALTVRQIQIVYIRTVHIQTAQRIVRLALTICWMFVFPGLFPLEQRLWAATQASESAGIEEFEKSVRPLLVSHCYECHSGSESKGGLLLDSRRGLVMGGDSGPAVVPKDPEHSLLIRAVRYGNSELQMPPKGRLSEDDVKLLEKWVAMGAPDPRTATETIGAPKSIGMSIEDGREFWSLLPISKPTPPKAHSSDWIQTPIDAFVLAKLEACGLSPAPPADKRTLIRRLTYDLIGLPPTPQEVDAFLADESPNAYSKIVDRLLCSSAYGVRWGRHWLDVVRYADSNGLDENLAYGNAWRYRDYVVDAWNDNKPFDRFLMEQLAGDLMKDASQETRTATGFLLLGAKVLAEPDRDKLEMDTIDEQLDTLGKVFLGMTFGCVRCHDHKFDPIKQSDYYALAAIFKSTKTFDGTNMGAIKHWHEHSFATDEQLTAIKEVEKQIAEKKAAAASLKTHTIAKIQDEARSKATEYLIAAAKFDLETPLTQIEAIAEPQSLHPHILHHCRRHLNNHRDDPFFRRWHELADSQDLVEMETHYRPLFSEANAALEVARQANPKAGSLDDPRLEAARAAFMDTAGFLAVPAQPQYALDEATYRKYCQLCEESRLFESNAPEIPSAMGVADGTIQPELAIHIRGSHHNLGKKVTRGFPEVMVACDSQTVLPADQSGRMELAQWMVSKQNPLTSRVFVNRIWEWHFGTAIVSSTENFGSLGDRPSHPELLDWLSNYFVENHWSIKNLHRLILASSTYQMASSHPDEEAAKQSDPENRLRWKFSLNRLDAEQIRDAILTVSGRLDASISGKTLPLRNRQFVFDHTSIDHTRYDSLRRSLYLPVIRNNVYPLFELFDLPDPTMPTGHRNATVVAPQALLMMNSDLVMDSADAFSQRLKEHSNDDAARVQFAVELAFGRKPTESESRRAIEFVGQTSNEAKHNDTQQQVWSVWCQSLMASNEFIYLR